MQHNDVTKTLRKLDTDELTRLASTHRRVLMSGVPYKIAKRSDGYNRTNADPVLTAIGVRNAAKATVAKVVRTNGTTVERSAGYRKSLKAMTPAEVKSMARAIANERINRRKKSK